MKESNEESDSSQLELCTKHWDIMKKLNQRLQDFNDFVRGRRELVDNVTKTKQGEAFLPLTVTSDLIRNSIAQLQTDASKRLSLRFHQGIDGERNNKRRARKTTKRSRQSCGLDMDHSDVPIVKESGGATERALLSVQDQLEFHTSKNSSRCANSIHFSITSSHKNISSEPNYPIPLGGDGMNPHLLLKLSCEKAKLNNGKHLMVLGSLHPTSQDIFIDMYWYIHCNFFQSNSSEEQKILLARVSTAFLKLTELLMKLVPQKQRDNFFWHYPIVLSRAIYFGFQYLCPGNLLLFKDPLLQKMDVLIFHLLTGVKVCPVSLKAMCTKLYPQEEINNGKTDDFLSVDRNACHNNDKDHTYNEETNICDDSGASSHGNTLQFSTARSQENESNSMHTLAIQKQVKFDVNQVSPLMQHCLDRAGISLRPNQYMKRIEVTIPSQAL